MDELELDNLSLCVDRLRADRAIMDALAEASRERSAISLARLRRLREESDRGRSEFNRARAVVDDLIGGNRA